MVWQPKRLVVDAFLEMPLDELVVVAAVVAVVPWILDFVVQVNS